MRNLFIVALLMSAIPITGRTQVIHYDTASIPAALKKNAIVVKRFEDIRFEVHDIDKAVAHTHQVFTVMSQEGKSFLSFVQTSSTFIGIGNIRVTMYDANGQRVKQYKDKDVHEAPSGEGLVDDMKYHYLMLSSATYPVTVEFEYDEVFRGTLFYPTYSIQTAGVSVEYSTFKAVMPKGLELRFKKQYTDLAPVESPDGSGRAYAWIVTNLPALPYEENAVSPTFRYPAIVLAPTRFKMENYEGSMANWQEFGKWYASLTKGLNVLPEDKAEAIRALVKEATTDEQKIDILYRHLRDNFRYVSIQLGIGGYKPFPASFTHDRKYGDCKGLSNYMQACLSAVGIKSYQALIRRMTRDTLMDARFPMNAFNHVILCVPRGTDTTWLECTSNTNATGVLGADTQDKNALLVTETGGVLVATPRSKAVQNIFSATTLVRLNEEGGGEATVWLRGQGEFRDEFLHYLGESPEDDQRSYLNRYLGLKQADRMVIAGEGVVRGEQYRLTMNFEKIPEFTAGSKLFINCRLYKYWSTRLKENADRRKDYYFECPFIRTDTTRFEIPDGFTVDVMPKELDIVFSQGSYRTKYRFDQDKHAIESVAVLTLNQHRIPPEKYEEARLFFDKVLEDSGQKLVIRKN